MSQKVCRITGKPLIELFSLGELYLSDFIPRDKDKSRLGKLELKLMLEPESGLVQLSETPLFDDMYKQYWYRSGISNTMKEELKDIVETIQKRFKGLKEDDIWIDTGSNDGTLLSNVDKKFFTLGYEPSNIAEESKEVVDSVINDYFKADKYIYKNKAKVITSIAMFYDLDDPNKFCQDVNQVLDDDGLWVIQMNYLPTMLQELAFDNISHEHIFYYSLENLKFLLERNGLKIIDCTLNEINGGSFRVFVMKKDGNEKLYSSSPYREVAKFRINALLNYEEKLGLKQVEIYDNFYKRINKLKEETMNFINSEVEDGKKIWNYGASTRGNMLLQYYGLTDKHIVACAEKQKQKFNLKTSGTNIPILPEKIMREQFPDYLLVLPWAFINEFIDREQDYLNRGGKFIVPCPEFRVIGKE